MAIVRLSDIRFYTGLTETAHQQWEMKKWLIDNNVKFIVMNYADDSQHEEVFESFKNRIESIIVSQFPILTYIEIHDDLEVYEFPFKCFTDLESLQNSSFLEDYTKNIK